MHSVDGGYAMEESTEQAAYPLGTCQPVSIMVRVVRGHDGWANIRTSNGSRVRVSAAPVDA